MKTAPQLLAELDRLRACAERHNTNPEYTAAGYPPVAPFCATIRYPDKPAYVALFNAPLSPGAALDRFHVIDANARLAIMGELTIELAALR